MITIVVTSEHCYRVVYHLEGVPAHIYETKDRRVLDIELDRLLILEMGLAKGKTFTAGMEKGSHV